jgi:glycosyltransferase involved in cell wall biosynthesis
MDTSDIFVSVILPLRNNGAEIDDAVVALCDVLSRSFKDYELIIVDDGSTDGTSEAIAALQTKFPNIQSYTLGQRHGEDIATVVGLDHCIGDFVVLTDLSRGAAEATPALVLRSADGFDVVYGVPATPTRSGLYGFFAAAFYRWLYRMTGLYVPPEATHLRCYSRTAVNYFLSLSNRHKLLRVFGAFGGLTSTTLGVSVTRRRDGLLAGCRRAVGLLLIASPQPMRIITSLALLGSLLNLLYAGYVVIIALVKNQVAEGWVSLSLQSAGMFFLVCLILALISESTFSLLRISIGQPLYRVAREATSSVLARRRELNVVQTDDSREWERLGAARGKKSDHFSL